MDQELLDELQIKICQRFKDQKLLQQALTHPKFDPECHYERLEFLGDSILNNAITIELYNHHSYDREGSLSRRREKLISNAYLTRVAVGKLDLAKYIRIPYGITPALCDFFEAIIGAVYLDAGPDKAHAVVTRCLWDKEFESRHRSRSPVDRPASANNNRSRQLDQFRTKRNGQPSAAVNSKRDASPVACSSQNRSSPSKENSSGKQVIDHTPAMRIYSRELIKTLDDNGIPFTELNALQGTHYKNPPEMRYSVRIGGIEVFGECPKGFGPTVESAEERAYKLTLDMVAEALRDPPSPTITIVSRDDASPLRFDTPPPTNEAAKAAEPELIDLD